MREIGRVKNGDAGKFKDCVTVFNFLCGLVVNDACRGDLPYRFVSNAFLTGRIDRLPHFHEISPGTASPTGGNIENLRSRCDQMREPFYPRGGVGNF